MEKETNIHQDDKDTLEESLRRIYHAGEAIPVLTELIDFICSYSTGDPAERPTEKWCDELLTDNTSYALKKVLNLLGYVVESESWEINKSLKLGLL